MGICDYHLRSGEKATAGMEGNGKLGKNLWRDLQYAPTVINSTFEVIDKVVVV